MADFSLLELRELIAHTEEVMKISPDESSDRALDMLGQTMSDIDASYDSVSVGVDRDNGSKKFMVQISGGSIDRNLIPFFEEGEDDTYTAKLTPALFFYWLHLLDNGQEIPRTMADLEKGYEEFERNIAAKDEGPATSGDIELTAGGRHTESTNNSFGIFRYKKGDDRASAKPEIVKGDVITIVNYELNRIAQEKNQLRDQLQYETSDDGPRKNIAKFLAQADLPKHAARLAGRRVNGNDVLTLRIALKDLTTEQRTAAENLGFEEVDGKPYLEFPEESLTNNVAMATFEKAKELKCAAIGKDNQKQTQR